MTIRALRERVRFEAIRRGLTVAAVLAAHGLAARTMSSLDAQPANTSLATCERLISLASAVRDPGTPAIYATGGEASALVVIRREELEALLAGAVQMCPDIEGHSAN